MLPFNLLSLGNYELYDLNIFFLKAEFAMHFQNALSGERAKGNEKEDSPKLGIRLTCTYLGCSLLGTLLLHLSLQHYFVCFLQKNS